MFEGFYEETIQFLWEIRLNNQRPWFQDHKQVYLDALYEPMKEFGAAVREELLAEHPKEQLELKVARIYRDARRIHYGGPYKDHLWFTLRPPMEQRHTAPVFYFEVMPEGYEYGLGYYCSKAALMETYRQHILDAPEKLERLARKLEHQTVFTLEGAEYKRPKGIVPDLLKPWFNRKELSLSTRYAYDDCFLSPELIQRVTQGFCWLMPYYRYLKEIQSEE